MRKNQFTLITFTFIAGLLMGATIIGLVAFTNPSPSVPSSAGVSKITLQQATTLARTYASTATPVNAVVKGFVLTRDQLSALSLLANENQALGLFRIYSGTDANGNRVGVVLGVDAQGSDITSGNIYMANGASSPCPPVCDANSPIDQK